MLCGEKNRLVSEYRIVVAAYSHAVSELQRRTGTTSRKEYDDLHRIAEDARDVSALALADLDRHVSYHGC
jgi:hypothetical protein